MKKIIVLFLETNPITGYLSSESAEELIPEDNTNEQTECFLSEKYINWTAYRT